MTTLRSHFKYVLPALTLSVVAATCHAGSIQLTPVRINLSSAAKVAVMTVGNTGSEESVMQVTLNKWSLEGGKDSYLRSDDLVITPTTFRLAPGAQQVVRIGMRDGAAVANEGAYRMLVEEIPPPPTPGVTETRLVVRHDLPVFIAPTGAARPALDFSVDCGGGGNLRVTNIGNVHAQLRNVVLETGPGRNDLAHWETAEYLLPSAQRTWGLSKSAPAASGKHFTATILTDQGSYAANVDSTCR